MMDWTDVHFRQLARLLSQRTWLWTEMVVDKTIIHTQLLDKYLWFPPEQRPLVLQLGGSDPSTLAAAAAKAAEYGYDEINLNCGCPSDRVAGAGCFGAALMMQPELVAQCMAAMGGALEAVRQPGEAATLLTVKCRLGVDEADSYAQLHEFVRVVSEGSPVRHFVVHARKAFLNGLSPHQNRTVPPLRHQWAWALARDFPHLQFSLNGGLLGCHDARAAILTAHPEVPYTRPVLPADDPRAPVAAVCGAAALAGGPHQGSAPPQCRSALPNGASSDPAALAQTPPVCSSGADRADGVGLDGAAADGNGGGIEGVMIGRGAYNDPWGCLSDADRAVYGATSNPAPSRRWVIEQYRQYAEPMVGRWFIKPDGHADPSVRTLMRPLLNLFHGEPGCKRWKNAVDEVLKAGPKTFGEVLDRTLHHIPDSVLDAPPRQPDLATLPPFPLDPVLPDAASRAGQNQNPPGAGARRGGSKARAQGGEEGAAPQPERVEAAGSGAGTGGDACKGVAEQGGGGACCLEAEEERRRAQAEEEAEKEAESEGLGAAAEAGGTLEERGQGSGKGLDVVDPVARGDEGQGAAGPSGGRSGAPGGATCATGGVHAQAASAKTGTRTVVVARAGSAAAEGGRVAAVVPGGSVGGKGQGGRRLRGCTIC